jgi:alpha-tubulin suppressor-like RCC1 family protein
MRALLFGGSLALSVVSVVAFVACGDSGGGSSTIVPPTDGGLEGSIIAEGSVDDASGEVTPPKPLFATRIGAGTAHACVVRSDGTVACWGQNTSYQLGVVDAGGSFSATPVHATALTGAVATVGTFATSCALLDTAELGCWGTNSGGLLGNLAAASFSEVPARVGDLHDVVAVTGGEKHACLLRAGGVAYCWGNNDDEQLGSGVPGAGNSGAPARVVDAPDHLKFIGSGATSSHTCAIRDDDQVVCWGLNNHTGQLGAPTFNDLRSPNALLVDNVSDATRVATGQDHSCALRKGGTMRCWGANDFGQVGFGTPAPAIAEKIAKDVPGITDAVALSLGDQRTCIVHATGKVSCWGNNPNGALGAGAADAGTYSVTPVEVAGITDAEDVALGVGFSCVLRKGGKVSCWGVDDKGQLGSGPADAGAYSSTPIEVVGL